MSSQKLVARPKKTMATEKATHRLAPEAVCEGGAGHLEEDDAEPERDVDQRHLGERETPLLGEVDDPDGEPELEVEEEVEDVVLPDVAMEEAVLAQSTPSLSRGHSGGRGRARPGLGSLF
jgi:hypothetical protein